MPAAHRYVAKKLLKKKLIKNCRFVLNVVFNAYLCMDFRVEKYQIYFAQTASTTVDWTIGG